MSSRKNYFHRAVNDMTILEGSKFWRSQQLRLFLLIFGLRMHKIRHITTSGRKSDSAHPISYEREKFWRSSMTMVIVVDFVNLGVLGSKLGDTLNCTYSNAKRHISA